jgi:asparagine synthase (glutamine-hydrolysing)
MCGIAGYLGVRDPELAESMSRVLAHRGPDDSGTYYDAAHGLGLVHRRLSIVGIDERGHEPIWNEDRTIALVYNGEIYNYPELRQSLSSHTFSSDMDGEVLLHLYEDEGTSFLSKLNGMFAFVIWDSKARVLWGARDHLGIKPLYYSLVKSGLIFASEIKGILAASPEIVSRDVDYQALGAHLQYLWAPTPVTMLTHVRSLRPGHFFTFKEGEFEESKWWDIEIPYPIETGRSLTSWAEEVWEVFKQSVKRQLMADVPLGAFLSGGVDSSAIVAAMRELNPGDDLTCYSMKVLGEKNRDSFGEDLGFAQSAAKWLDVDLREVEGSASFIDSLDDLLWHLEAPIADSAPFFLRSICKRAKADGLKVLLAGTGGDDIFSGYRRHQAVFFSEHLSKTLGRGPALLVNALASMVALLGAASGRLRRVRKLAGLLSSSPEDLVRASFEWVPRSVVTSLVPELSTRDFREPLAETLAAVRREPSLLHRQLYIEAKHFLGDHNLLYTDKLSMAESVEVRVPFLDREMLAIVSRMPEEMKLNAFSTKRVLREALVTKIPPEILSRSKAGFGGPVRDWLIGPLRPHVEEVVGGSSSPFFERKVLRSLWEQTLANKADFAYLILGVVMVERWRHLFLKPFEAPKRAIISARASG